MKSLALTSTLLIFSALTLNGQTWQIADNYEITFETSQAEGSFRGLEGTINFDPDNLATASFKVSVDVNTIATGNKTKDGHARGKRWFNAELFPRITFNSTSVKLIDGKYHVKGNLEMKGIKKEITIPLSYQDQAFMGSFTVNREDFGIKGNMFGFMVGDEVNVNLKVPVKKAS